MIERRSASALRADRRTFLRLAGGAIVLSAACPPLLAAARHRATLLVPLTGTHAGLGLSMRRAAALAQSDAETLTVVDSAASGAVARAARGGGLILGPVFTGEVRAVLAAARGRGAVVTFSNDDALRDSGAFLLGLGAGQLTAAILRYARGRGVRTVAVAPGEGGWHAQARATADRLQGELGLTIRAAGLDADALLVTDVAAPSVAAARAAGVQLLVAAGAVDPRPETLAALSGAWLAAPDPETFENFAERYRGANGGEPGLLAALAHDAAMVAAKVGGGGRAALLDPAGFGGATGPFRFRADGSAERTLAILAAAADGYTVIGQSRGA